MRSPTHHRDIPPIRMAHSLHPRLAPLAEDSIPGNDKPALLASSDSSCIWNGTIYAAWWGWRQQLQGYGGSMSLSDGELANLLCSPSQLRTFSDANLMAALCFWCNDAFTVLFQRHNVLVFRIARAILRDHGEAEETVQRVFLDVFNAKEQFD